MGKWQKVIACLTGAAIIWTTHVAAQTPLQAIELCRRANRASERIQFCTLAIQHASDRKTLERLFLRRGNSFMETGAYADAVSDFSKLIVLNRKVAGYFDNRLYAFRALGRFNEALEDANSAIALAPSQAFVFRSRGLVFESLHRLGLALADFDRAIGLNPSDTGLRVYRARIKVEAGRSDEAVTELTEIITSDPNNMAARRERGLAFRATGKRAQALADLRVYAQANPADQEVNHAVAALQEPSPEDNASLPPASPRPNPSEQEKVGTGTGFFVSQDGSILTNAHVVEGCSVVQVRTSKADGGVARVITRDTTNDIALLRLDGSKIGLFGQLRSGVRTGESITVFGFPLYGLLATSGNFTVGNISATAGLGDDTRYLQISAPIQPGNSGGPVLDQAGNVVGMVVSKLNVFKVAAVIEDVPQNVNFAIKAGVLANFMETTPTTPMLASSSSGSLTVADLAEKAKAISVFIRCTQTAERTPDVTSTPPPVASADPAGRGPTLLQGAARSRWAIASSTNCTVLSNVYSLQFAQQQITWINGEGNTDVEALIADNENSSETVTLRSKRTNGSGVAPGTTWDYVKLSPTQIRVTSSKGRSFNLVRCGS
jgi:S1-C subfamily serine protease